MRDFIALGYGDVALAASLVLLNAGLSLWFQLGLARRLLIAAARMAAQLLLIGLVLKWLFAASSPLWTLLAALLMLLFAGREARARQERTFRGWWGYGLGATSMLMASFLVTIFALTTQVRPDPWFDPRYAIPLLGMILGNTMTGVSLGLDSLTRSAFGERAAIETRLALGQSRFEALRSVTHGTLRTAMIPIINSMAASGIVSLPGMMTGQILAGVEPVEAVKYQLMISFLIAGGTGLGVLAAVMGGASRITDARHRLRLDRLTAPR
jgi:putative ABC transport system permease protein